MDKEGFAHKLIKGKIAETIFEMMFREAGEFTVHRFGYEYTESLVAQYQNKVKLPEVLDTIRHTPDFILIEEPKELNEKKGIYIVEVKYKSSFNKQNLIDIATEVVQNWPISHIFLISKGEFYFSSVHAVRNSGGSIELLSTSWVSREIQDKYKKLAADWLWSHKEKDAEYN